MSRPEHLTVLNEDEVCMTCKHSEFNPQVIDGVKHEILECLEHGFKFEIAENPESMTCEDWKHEKAEDVRLLTGVRCGKTSELIRRSAKDGGRIVCATHEMAMVLEYQAERAGLTIAHPLTFDELLKGRFEGKYHKGFHLDNLDYLLQQITSPVPILTVTSNTPIKKISTKGVGGELMEEFSCSFKK